MKANILVFPCGSEIGLEIHNSLKFVKGINLFGGSSVSDHGRFVYKNYIGNIPNYNDEKFITVLNDIIAEYQIDYIFPAHDHVVLKLSECQQALKAEVITSPYKTCRICRSKAETYSYFQDYSFIPKVYRDSGDVDEFPVFLKPDIGQGSKGVAIANNSDELERELNRDKNLVICEYLPGKEYTVDCFTDRHGKLLFMGMRERRRVKSGISVNSITLSIDEQVRNIGELINEKLKFRGVWFFQVKKAKDGNFKLLEIAPRVAGTMSVHRNKGVNFALLSIFDRLDIDVSIIENNVDIEVDRALVNRFKLSLDYSTVYIDFDDTITRKGVVNPYVMMFLYQCLVKKKKLILVTKHINDIRETFARLKIDENIFDKIIHISQGENKYKYFDDKTSAIFIDDSFSERKNILEKTGIPVFDIDSIESLIDWRY